MQVLEPPDLDTILRAAQNVSKKAIRTPVVKLNLPKDNSQLPNIYLKLENLQPIGSFKVRPSTNALASVDDVEVLKRGVCTASAGNFAQGLAWACSDIGVRCSVVVPEHAPESKLAAIRRLGGDIIKVPFASWWDIIETHTCPQAPGAYFIHPGAENAVLAGNATVALEIVEDLPQVDCIVAPYGSGALATGLACGIKALRQGGKMGDRECAIVAVEPETAAPFSLSMKSGKAVEFTSYQPSFVDGCGGKRVLEEVWQLSRKMVSRGCSVPLSSIADAVKILVERNHVVAEGAGACSVAAALAGMCGPEAENIVCVVSGSGIDTQHLITCLQGNIPCVPHSR